MDNNLCVWVGPHMSLTKSVTDKIHLQLSQVPDLSSLIQHVNQPQWKPSLFVFDSQVLCATPGISIMDVLHICSILDRTSSQPTKPALAVWVTAQTSGVLLKQLMISGLHGAVPDPSHWGEYSTHGALCNLINKKRHWPKCVLSLTHKPSKTTHTSMAPKLTFRQSQVLNLIITLGASNKVIARRLNISESTVKVHVGAIFKKYGVRNRTQLALCGVNGKL